MIPLVRKSNQVRTVTKTPPSTDKPSSKTDWEAIARAYRAGVKSIRQIAGENGVSDTAIRKKATEQGWQRDLTERVNEQARASLVRNSVRAANPEAEQEIVEEAAEQVVTIVRGHRTKISRQEALVDLLTQQLVDVAGNRDDFEQAIEDETAEDQSGKRRSMLMKAIALPTHASTAVNLANALKSLIGMERQAYSIKDESETPISQLGELLKQVSGTGLPIVKDQAQDEPDE